MFVGSVVISLVITSRGKDTWRDATLICEILLSNCCSDWDRDLVEIEIKRGQTGFTKYRILFLETITPTIWLLDWYYPSLSFVNPFLKRRELISDPENFPIKCGTCLRQLQQGRCIYKRHYRAVHLKIKDYVCGICGEQFSHYEQRKRHLRRCHAADRIWNFAVFFWFGQELLNIARGLIAFPHAGQILPRQEPTHCIWCFL